MKSKNLNLFLKLFCGGYICLFSFTQNTFSQELYPVKLSPKTWHNQELELRYHPEGKDFVITNGKRLFTRALYGTNTAFRVETGDRPEFALYMPGMGGNFKLGISVNQQSKWLTQADSIIARYRAGARLYTIKDTLLGNGTLEIEILALADGEGFILKTQGKNLPKSTELYWAFGGATGKKFSRDGDMGPDPESNFYLQANNCKDNQYVIPEKGKFILKYGTGLPATGDGRYFAEDAKQPVKPSKEQILQGTFPSESALKIADAQALASPLSLYQSQAEKAPVICGKLAVEDQFDYFFTIYNPATKADIQYEKLPRIFQEAEKTRETLANRIQINTPDPFINTIGGTLAIASDAIWDSPTYMHGSIGWRMRLPGWRGPYTADVLGWHNRAKTHLEAYALSQFTTPLYGPIKPDSTMHFARSTEKSGVGMFSNGYINRDPNGANLRPHHYDMNLVYIDQLLRHFAWTKDTTFMRQTWSVIKRHLDWEVRNFDIDKNHLFDAYAAIWASDALQYSGGDVTHTSAYNYLGFKKAAQIAKLMGDNPSPYLEKAEKILKAMNQILWMPQKGTFAEFKDALGNKLLHPSAGIWTIYHSIDSEVPDKFQAYQMLRYVDNEIPHIPIRAKGLEDKGYYTLSTTNWMPYMWSLNNVALAESMHLILANWQAGRTDEAFKLFKSEVLQSMYLGGSPGNIVQISYFDAARGEAYRDFADPVGMFSRALVEGLFGIVPDALNNTLLIRPGLPATWDFASFKTPDISFDFKRKQKTDTYIIAPTLPTKVGLKFQVLAQGQVEQVLANGKSVSWTNVIEAVGKPMIEISLPNLPTYEIVIVWKGEKPILPTQENVYVNHSEIIRTFTNAKVVKVFDAQKVVRNIQVAKNQFTAQIQAPDGNYMVFAQLQQGSLSWWMPICFKVKPAIELVSTHEKEENITKFCLQNNTSNPLLAQVFINHFKAHLKIEAGKLSDTIVISENDLLCGTNQVRIVFGKNQTLETTLVNWKGKLQLRQETVDISPFFNDKVTQIFQNKYLSPRPQATTLQLPWQGIGDWPHPHESFEVKDEGLRKLAQTNDQFELSQGIRFKTPSDPKAHNIVFTSQWDNYPNEKVIPLSGSASHAWFLMAGSTNPMQSQLDNGVITVQYTNGTEELLALRNPETWWPIDQDYFTDDFAFKLKQARPIRIHLATGKIVDGQESKAFWNGKKIEGGAATILDMPLNPKKTLKSVTLKTLTNDVVIGLMSITLGH